MQFTDAVAISGTRMTRDGYMVAECRVARTGCQMYSGDEVGRPEIRTVNVWRPDTEVFNSNSLQSFAFKPVVIGHPDKSVTAGTWRDVAVGFVGGDVLRDQDYVKVPLALMDQKAIDSVRNGTRELSMGYECDLEFVDGETPEGEKYQAIQRGILINHAALVPRGRAGPECRVGDSWPSLPTIEPKEKEMPEVALRSVTVDGITVSTTDQGAEVITKLLRQLADATSAVSSKDAELTAALQLHTGAIDALKSDHRKVVEGKDGELAALKSANEGVVDALKSDQKAALEAKDGEIVALKAQIPDAAAMDAMIATRAKVIDAAKKILDAKFDPAGKTLSDIRRAAVQKRLGDAAVADKSDEYITAAFDTLTAVGVTKADPVRDALAGTPTSRTPVDTTDAHDAYVASLRDGWKAKE